MKIVKHGSNPAKSSGFHWDYDTPVTCHRCRTVFYLEPTDRVALHHRIDFAGMAVIEFGCPVCGQSVAINEFGYQVRDW